MDLQRKLRTGERPAGGWCSIPSPSVAEALATAAFDFVVVDTEHAPTTTESVENMVRAVEAAPGDAETLVRVAENDPTRIKRVLDAGPAGVMAPRVNSPAAARDLVRACRYPPQAEGNGGPEGVDDEEVGPRSIDDEEASPEGVDDTPWRGVAASRASDYGRRIDDYVRSDGDDVAVIAQIETARAVDAAAGIAAVPGIDALLVGPADLSASLGRFREFDHPTVRNAIADAVAGADAADVPIGTLATSDEGIDAWLDAGFDFLIVGTDVGFMSAGADRALNRYADGT